MKLQKCENVWRHLAEFWNAERFQRCKNIWRLFSPQRRTTCRSCRSRQQELSNEYLLAKIGVDTAKNEPSKVWLPACLWPPLPPGSIKQPWRRSVWGRQLISKRTPHVLLFPVEFFRRDIEPPHQCIQQRDFETIQIFEVNAADGRVESIDVRNVVDIPGLQIRIWLNLNFELIWTYELITHLKCWNIMSEITLKYRKCESCCILGKSRKKWSKFNKTSANFWQICKML